MRHHVEQGCVENCQNRRKKQPADDRERQDEDGDAAGEDGQVEKEGLLGYGRDHGRILPGEDDDNGRDDSKDWNDIKRQARQVGDDGPAALPGVDGNGFEHVLRGPFDESANPRSNLKSSVTYSQYLS